MQRMQAFYAKERAEQKTLYEMKILVYDKAKQRKEYEND